MAQRLDFTDKIEELIHDLKISTVENSALNTKLIETKDILEKERGFAKQT